MTTKRESVLSDDVIVKQRIFLYSSLLGVLIAGTILSVPGLAQTKPLTMLEGLAKGEWTLRFRDGSEPRRVCIRAGDELIQLQHNERNCSRFIVEDKPGAVTVQYTCRGNGYGRTSIRRETNSLVQVESQGIADGLPFNLRVEARLTGTCS